MSYDTILYREDGPLGWLTLNRPHDGNMFTETMCHEIRDCIETVRRETRTRVMILTGAGDRFFCIGGRKDGMEKSNLYAGVLPTLEIYEAIDRLQKPVIAAVNGFAVGGGERPTNGLRRYDCQAKRDFSSGWSDDGVIRCWLWHLVS